MTRTGTRYGCFLPDLTGLARDPSTASLPGHYIRLRPLVSKGGIATDGPIRRSLVGSRSQMMPDKRKEPQRPVRRATGPAAHAGVGVKGMQWKFRRAVRQQPHHHRASMGLRKPLGHG